MYAVKHRGKAGRAVAPPFPLDRRGARRQRLVERAAAVDLARVVGASRARRPSPLGCAGASDRQPRPLRGPGRRRRRRSAVALPWPGAPPRGRQLRHRAGSGRRAHGARRLRGDAVRDRSGRAALHGRGPGRHAARRRARAATASWRCPIATATGTPDETVVVGSGYDGAHSLAFAADGTLLVAGNGTLFAVELGPDLRRALADERSSTCRPTAGTPRGRSPCCRMVGCW